MSYLLAITILCETIMNTADAISKLEEALVFNPIKHDALWLLGNCFANQALMASDLNEINGYKDKASACYQKALYAVNYSFHPFTFFISISSTNLIEC